MPDSGASGARAMPLSRHIRPGRRASHDRDDRDHPRLRRARRLTRARDGRWLGGVAAGLGSPTSTSARDDLPDRVRRRSRSPAAPASCLYVAAWPVDARRQARRTRSPPRRSSSHRDRPWLLSRRRRCSRSSGSPSLSSARFWPSPRQPAGWRRRSLGAAIVWWQTGRQRAAPSALAADAAATRYPVCAAAAAASTRSPVGVADRRSRPSSALVDVRPAGASTGGSCSPSPQSCLGRLIAAGAAARARRSARIVVLGSRRARLLRRRARRSACRVFADIGDRRRPPLDGARIGRLHATSSGSATSTVDLSDVPLPAGETHVKSTLGIGDLVSARARRTSRSSIDCAGERRRR